MMKYLEDLAIEIVDGDRGSNYPKQADFLPTGHCLFLSARNVTTRGFDLSEVTFISEDKDKALRKGKLHRNDVVLTTRGTIGNLAYFDSRIPFDDIRINSGMVLLRTDESEYRSRFLYYLLRSTLIQNQIESLRSGTAQPHLPIRDIRKLRLPLFPPGAQDFIAEVIGALDHKIELNRRMNRTLEAMAQAIFKSWFVNFEPVKAKAAAKAAGASPEEIERAAMAAIAGKTETELDQLPEPRQQSLARTAALFPAAFQKSELGEIPAGWSLMPMNSLCTLNPESWTKKNHPDTVDYVDLANTKNGYIQEIQLYDWNIAPRRARRILKGGDTIVGTVRPGNRSFAFVHETGNQLTASTGFAVLRPRENYLREFNNIALTSDANIERLTQLADGAAYPAVRPDVVAGFSLAMPNKILLKLFSTIVWPMFDLSEKNSNQTRTLAQLRDILLPKLLSGELNVPEAN